MAAETKLEAARRKGNLAAAIGALREEARAETGNEREPVREQLDIVDASIRVAAGLSAQGTKGAERRQAISAVQPGSTVTSKGVAKTVLTREQRLQKTVTWLNGLTPEQRDHFMASERFESLSDRQQELISDAFTEVDNSEFSTDLADIDLEAEPVDIDSLPEDETEAAGDSFEVLEGEDIESFDVDDAAPGSEMSYEYQR
jgi:hypothetical protein